MKNYDEQPGLPVKRIKISKEDARKIKDIICVDSRAPLVVTAFGPSKDLHMVIAEEGFEKTPFQLVDQTFAAIIPCTYTITRGSHNVTYTVAGESNTQSYPDDY